MRRINQTGLELIKQYEGLSLDPYYCPAGLLTIGYGHVCAVSEYQDGITQEEAERLLSQDLHMSEAAVERAVEVEISDDAFAALVSLAFNIGGNAFKRSTLLKKLNNGDYVGAAAEFPRWNKAAGRALPGLTARRLREQELFGNG